MIWSPCKDLIFAYVQYRRFPLLFDIISLLTSVSKYCSLEGANVMQLRNIYGRDSDDISGGEPVKRSDRWGERETFRPSTGTPFDGGGRGWWFGAQRFLREWGFRQQCSLASPLHSYITDSDAEIKAVAGCGSIILDCHSDRTVQSEMANITFWKK